MQQHDNIKKDSENVRLSLVSASETAAYVYCPEAWRLQHCLKLPSDHPKALAWGTTVHARWQKTERRSRVLVHLGVIGVVAVLGLLVFRALVG